MQARFREEREKRRACLGPPHKYLLCYVADHLDLENAVVEDFILDGAEVSTACAHSRKTVSSEIAAVQADNFYTSCGHAMYLACG